ncbi:MAG: aldo/keto reductase, partial [Deltaproteobacteria bacterium]|nr:aldo/keto reductase [Deltaproteobacteria bacterium]
CPIPCTDCRYCMPCPHGVDIPYTLLSYNQSVMYDNPRRARLFSRQLPLGQQANNCEECYECEDICPQSIPIVEWLEKAHDWLGPKKK